MGFRVLLRSTFPKLCSAIPDTLAFQDRVYHSNRVLSFGEICRSEWFPRTRKTKRSCACDCGRRPVSVGAFFFSLAFFFRSLSHPESRLKIKIYVGNSDVLGVPGEELVRAPGGRSGGRRRPWKKKRKKYKNEKNEKMKRKRRKKKGTKGKKKQEKKEEKKKGCSRLPLHLDQRGLCFVVPWSF